MKIIFKAFILAISITVVIGAFLAFDVVMQPTVIFPESSTSGTEVSRIYQSGWLELSDKYSFSGQKILDDKEKNIIVKKRGENAIYSVLKTNMDVNELGLYISPKSILTLKGKYLKVPSTFEQIYITWDKIFSCTNIKNNKLLLIIEDTDITIEIDNKDIQSPVYTDKGIPIVE